MKLKLKRFVSSISGGEINRKKKLLLIDNHGLLYRSYFANPGIAYLVYNPRTKLYSDYKGNRPELPLKLISLLKSYPAVISGLGLREVRCTSYESDDAIASYAKVASEQDMQVDIVTSDKDMFQLITENISVYSPAKKYNIVTEEDVSEKFGGASCSQVADVQALCGDGVDNIPGVPGIGPAKAGELIRHLGNLENLLSNLDQVKSVKTRELLLKHIDNIRLWKKLTLLDVNIPLPIPIDSLRRDPLDKDKVIQFLSSRGMKSVIKSLQKED